MDNKEVRDLHDNDIEVRVVGNSRKVEGYGFVFNRESVDLGGFTEVILPGAADGIIEQSDVYALVNHNRDKGVLARSNKGDGTLTLSIDERGLKYSFDAPNFDLGNELIEGIRRGDIKKSSFAFSVAEGGAKMERREGQPWLRTITKFDLLYDVSPCYQAAYNDTSVAMRSLDEIKNLDSTIIPEETEERAEVKTDVEETPDPITERKPESPKVEKREDINNDKTTKIKNKMTHLELIDLKTQLSDNNDKIIGQAYAEKRSRTDAENIEIQSNMARLREINMELELEGLKGVPGQPVEMTHRYVEPKKKFSLIKSINEAVTRKQFSEEARDVFTLGGMDFRKAGINPIGDILIPAPEVRTAIAAGSAGYGQEVVAEDKKAILPPLTDKLIFSQLGATFMTGLVGNVSIPSYAGTTVAWKAENTTAVDGAGAFAEVNFSPKKLCAFLTVSKTFLAQDGVGAERLLLDNIASSVARKLEATILGVATVHADYPSGIGYKMNVANGGGAAVLTGATLTNAAIVGLETTVETANAAAGSLAYVTNAKGRGLLKVIDKGVSNDTGIMICENNMVNGYPLVATNAIPSTYGAGGDGNAVFFGNWADLCIAQWGGYDITVDPYTAAKTNQVIIVINAYFDAKGLRGSTGSSTTLDEYAYSFAGLSIK